MNPPAAEDRIVSSHEINKELQNVPPQKFHSSSLPFLDRLIGGFAAGDFIVLGGNTGAGKTTFLQTITRNFAKQDIGCLWFSVELSYREFLGRFGKNLPVFYVPRIMPNITTHEWIEAKILEAKKEHDVQIVFIDHIGMVVDEKVAWSSNSVDIFDARIFRLKRFALKNQVAIIAVAPLVQSHLRSKKKEPSEGDFRGSAMIAYTADTLLHLERLEGRSAFQTVNEEFPSLDDMNDNYRMPQDSKLYIVKSRRTGVKKTCIRLELNKDGDLIEST